MTGEEPPGGRRFFCLTRSREGAKKTKTRKNGGMSCRCAAIHAAGRKALIFLLTEAQKHREEGAFFVSREGAKARRRQRQGRMAACLAAGRAARKFRGPTLAWGSILFFG